MCTVSWVQRPDGIDLFCSRDELRTRLPAEAPRRHDQGGIAFLAPVDTQAGGTWLAANERGLVLALLNGPVVPGPVGRSRGHLVRELASAPSAAEAERRLAALSLAEFAPFRLLALEPGAPPRVLRWDGIRLAPEPARAPLVSSSLRPESVERTRQVLFRERLGTAPVDPEALLDFHREHRGPDRAHAVCMHRPDAETHSLTWVRIDADAVSMRYAAGAPCQAPLGAPVVLPRLRRAPPVRRDPGPLAGWRQGCGAYRAEFVGDRAGLQEVQALRYRVFNLELGEGLAGAHALGRDEDEFDPRCEHLVVRSEDGDAVGTYRLMTLEGAGSRQGFYSAREFDLGGLPAEVLDEGLELGRACIASHHRGRPVLALLWRGIAAAMRAHRKRFLFGCASLPTTDPARAARTVAALAREGHAPLGWPVVPAPGFELPAPGPARAPSAGGAEPEPAPELLGAYLSMGARLVGQPALDREFGTIDHLIVLDVASMPDARRRRFGLESLGPVAVAARA